MKTRRINVIPTPAEINYSEKFVPFAVTGVRVCGEYGEGLIHAISLMNENLEISNCGNLIIYNGFENFPQKIKEETKELFEKRFAKQQGYYLTKNGDEIIIAAHAENGCMYGIMTLIQLFDGSEIPETFEIKDSPDFYGRGVKWLMAAELGVWSYDRGDGVEKFKERIIKKLDMCLKYKINTVNFNGYDFKSERFPGYNDLMKTLNREARKRKICLGSGGYAMGYGASGQEGVFLGEIHKNRKSYPDGEVYKCIGTYVEGCPEDEVTAREYGTCLSNEELMEQKLREIKAFIKNTEPSAISLHCMDADDILPPLWNARCDKCREKWPNDSLWAEDGAAGAFAYFINNLYKGLISVKSDDGNYDAAKDCTIRIASPAYSYMHKDEELFEGNRKFWQKVSELLPHYDNLIIGFRENFLSHDTGELRFDKMRKGWKNCDFAVGYFCGGDGFYSDKLFHCGCLFSRLMKSAASIKIYNGNANQEPLQLCNAEYMWNSENSAYYNIPDIPQTYEEFEPFYIDYLKGNTRPEEIYGENGFLKIICEKLYGKEAAQDFYELFSIHGEDGAPPLISPCSCEIYTNFTKVVFPMRWDNADLKEDSENGLSINSILKKFIEVDRSTKKAKEVSAKIYAEKKYFAELESDVKWLAENFALCARYSDMFVRYMQCYKAVNAYFTKGQTIPEGTAEKLENLKKEADELLAEVVTMGLKAIDHMGGAIVRREKIADFLSYSAEIMLRSIEENVRIPSGLRPLEVRRHW